LLLRAMLLTGMKCWKIYTKSAKSTEQLGSNLGSLLKGGEIIELVSDIGGGKTTLTKGIAKGIGCRENVSSPTFTLSKVYKGSALELHHYDFYRLSNIGLMEEDVKEVICNTENVTVVEWARDAHDIFPKNRTIRIELMSQKEENDRKICLMLPKEMSDFAQKLGAAKC